MGQLIVELLGALLRTCLFYLLALPLLLLIATPVIFIIAIFAKRPYWAAVGKLYRSFLRTVMEVAVISPFP